MMTSKTAGIVEIVVVLATPAVLIGGCRLLPGDLSLIHI